MLRGAKNILGGAKLPIPVSCNIVTNFFGGRNPALPPGCGPAMLHIVGYALLLVLNVIDLSFV